MNAELALSSRATPGVEPLGGEACAHCGLPVPAALRREGGDHFCCRGCETAHGIIHACGLGAYYRLRQSTEERPAAVAGSNKSYDEFDDRAFHDLYVRVTPGGLSEATLVLEGVHCAACVWLVEKLPVVAPGVVESRLDFGRATVRVVWNEAVSPLSVIARSLDGLGYAPHPARGGGAARARRDDDRRAMVRTAVAGAAAGNVMLLAFALYGGVFAGIDPAFRGMFRWLSMGLAGLSLAWPGSVFFRGAWAALRTRTLHLDVPIALGLGVGGLAGLVNTVRGVGEVYFDSLTVLVFLLLVGRCVQARQQRRAADSVELLYAMAPCSARRVQGGTIREVPVEALSAGDEVEVLAGGSIPADGVVLAGESNVDQSLLTGESLPVPVAPGARLAAGAVNLSAALRLRVEATGDATRIGRLMRSVCEESAARAPIVRAADRLAGRFVGVVLATAAITLGAWLWIDPARAVDIASAVLIVTCPCALALATPLSMSVAIGRAARRGIVVKGGEALERLAAPGTLLLDKTGTITEGRMAVLRWEGSERAKALAAALEAQSAHPIARAICAAVEPAGAAHRVVQRTGSGIEGEVAGRFVRLGTADYVLGRDAARAGWVVAAEESIISEGQTPVLVAVDEQAAAVAGLGDPIRAGARRVLAELRGEGWSIGVLSGDHARVVESVAAAVGVDRARARGGVSPEQKLAAVKDSLRAGPVVMVGDGVNDAAALAAATVGIAVHGGAEASLAAADVYIARPGMEPLAELFTASRQTMRAIRRCLLASLVYNATAGTLAVTGLIHPIVAAVLMPLSSLTVLGLALRSRTFGNLR